MRISGNPDSPADYGVVEDVWERQFVRRAEYVHLRGGETVIAARLQGTHPQVVRVRAGSHTRTVTTDWRIVDMRTGTEMNITDITPTEDRQWLDFLCKVGVVV